jgi:hypothetical protein
MGSHLNEKLGAGSYELGASSDSKILRSITIGQRSEYRGQRSEIRGQTTEDRDRRLEIVRTESL